VQQGGALGGSDAACVQCHRRSGLGGSEGQNAIRPIAGRLLFSAVQAEGRWAGAAGGAAARPPYTRAALARALREGVDPSGRVLDALMPRYVLSDDEIDRLHAYLAGLSSTIAPGVTDREIHFSTIIAPDVDADRRRALLEVLQAFFRDKNGGTRKEGRRREVGSEPMYRAFRTWVLHVWELRGAPETWPEQLDAHYRRQPVFAVLGGLGGADWQPVHAFCEEQALPCVFPDVDYPVATGAGYYSVYFSRGLVQETEVLAAQLAAAQAGKATVVQVFRDDSPGRLQAGALRDAMQRRGAGSVVDYPLSDRGPASAAFWSRLLHDTRPAILVVWLDDVDLRTLGAGGPPPAGLQAIYLPAGLSATRSADLPGGWLDRARLVTLFEPEWKRGRHLARMQAWLRARKIPLTDARTQANAYFAASLVGDVMAHLGENFFRDYFIESIEQMTEVSLAASIYPHLSLGPGQRFASRGGYVVGFPREAGGAPVPPGDWRIP
jgi:hypothetical protein